MIADFRPACWWLAKYNDGSLDTPSTGVLNSPNSWAQVHDGWMGWGTAMGGGVVAYRQLCVWVTLPTLSAIRVSSVRIISFRSSRGPRLLYCYYWSVNNKNGTPQNRLGEGRTFVAAFKLKHYSLFLGIHGYITKCYRLAHRRTSRVY